MRRNRRRGDFLASCVLPQLEAVLVRRRVLGPVVAAIVAGHRENYLLHKSISAALVRLHDAR